MRAALGDKLIIKNAQDGRADRVGTIVALNGEDGAPPYLVHWVIGDYDSLISPWPGIRISHEEHDSGCGGASPGGSPHGSRQRATSLMSS